MWEVQKTKKSQRAHSNVKNSQMLVFKMENSGHKLKSKASLLKNGETKQKIPSQSLQKGPSAVNLDVSPLDPCWTTDFQTCETIDL